MTGLVDYSKLHVCERDTQTLANPHVGLLSNPFLVKQINSTNLTNGYFYKVNV